MTTLSDTRSDQAVYRHWPKLWSIVGLLLVRLMVTLGDEKAISFPPSQQVSIRSPPIRQINVTHLWRQHSTSPWSTSSPELLPVSLPLTHTQFPNSHPTEEDFSKQEIPPALSTLQNAPLTEEYGVFVTSPSAAANSSVRKSTKHSKKQFCSKTFAFLDKCLAHIPPNPDTGIPSTPHAVEAACKMWNMGMSCVDEWASKCLKKEQIAQFKASISGAHETFTFLCRDHKFRQEFLKHGDCFKRISSTYDKCSIHFIDNMKRFHSENATIQCCVRLSFLQCVSKISHYYCNREAAKFLLRMAEALVRTTMRTNTPPQCVSIHLRNCPMVNASSGPAFTTTTTTFTRIFLLITLLLLR